MNRSKVTVASIKPSSNPEMSTVEFRQTIAKPNAVGIFIGKPSEESLVAWAPILNSKIKELGLVEGKEVSHIEGFPLNLRVVETTTPRKDEGTMYKGKQISNAKINPSTGETLKYQGQTIYRYVDVDLTGAADERLAHDKAGVNAPALTAGSDASQK